MRLWLRAYRWRNRDERLPAPVEAIMAAVLFVLWLLLLNLTPNMYG